ncbi:hypothetical protein D9M70_255270 [compost metagenome]
MHQRRNGAHAELPLEAKGQVQQDAAQGQEHGQAALVTQLLAHLRADELDALELELALGIDLAQGFGNLVAQLRVVASQTHQHVGGGTEALHHGIRIAHLTQLLLDQFKVRRFLVGQLDQGAAGEVQAEVQALGEQGTDTDEADDHGNGERNVAYRHETDG